MKVLTTTTLAIAATALFATSAQAGEMKAKSATMTQTKTTTMVKTIDADNQVGQMTVYTADRNPQKTAVLGALAMQKTDAYVVQDDAGDLYINHLLSVSELPDPALDVREVETYTVEYRGMTFTNRVVAE